MADERKWESLSDDDRKAISDFLSPPSPWIPEISNSVSSSRRSPTQEIYSSSLIPRPLRRVEAFATWVLTVALMTVALGPVAYWLGPKYTTLEGFETLSVSFSTVGTWFVTGALTVPLKSRQLRKSFEPSMADEGFGYFAIHTAIASLFGAAMWLEMIINAINRRTNRQ